MKELSKQLVMVWNDMKLLQRGASVAIVLFVMGILGFVLMGGSEKYVPLSPGKVPASSEIGEIRNYLDHFAIPYKEGKTKGLLVLAEHVEQIRMELATAGIPKQDKGKGFELFDTNTWIKGEKELQVLEMRALKGQLEKDLAAFEHIKSASVILDIPPPRGLTGSLGGVKYQTKASVILTLKAGARLSSSELRAITNHLAGAVRGLEPQMIAVSDTSGKLYKAMAPQGGEEMWGSADIFFEERLEEKMALLLTHLIGEDHFHLSVQAVFEKEKPLSLSVAVVIDQSALGREGNLCQQEIERQLAEIAKGYGFDVQPAVDFIPFDRAPKIWTENRPSKSYLRWIVIAVMSGAILASLLPFLYRRKKKSKDEEETLFRVMTRMDLTKLAGSFQNEDPATIALMLSYLEPTRAQQMIEALDEDLQEEVLFHLAEIA